jgi:hypothetical protein
MVAPDGIGSGGLSSLIAQFPQRELRLMKDTAAGSLENDNETNVLLDSVIAAHYLALQLRRLPQGLSFRGREATEFLAAALTEWARLAEGDIIAPQGFFAQQLLCGRH